MASSLIVGPYAAAAPAPPAAPAGPAERRVELLKKSLGILHAALGNEDPEVRVLAAEQWGMIGNKAIVQALKTALRDRNGYVRIAAATSLYQLGDKSGMPVVASIIGAHPSKPKTRGPKPDPVKQEAPKPPPSPVEELRSIARNKVRIAAIGALSQMTSTDAVKVLVGAKEDSDGFVRDAAAVALTRLGSPEEMDRFVEALDSADPGERLTAVKRLGDIGTPGALPHLRRMAQDPDAQVRAAAMQGLGAVGDPEAIAELAAGMRDADDLVRSNAVDALGRLRSAMAVPLLREAYEKSASAYVRLLAVGGLVRSHADVDLGTAQRSLTVPDADTRRLAVEILEAQGGSQAVDLLEYALEDSSAKVRARAAAAIIKLLK